MYIEENGVYHIDYEEGLRFLEDGSIDLVITDPPYNFKTTVGGGFYDRRKEGRRQYLDELSAIKSTKFKPLDFLEQLKPKMKQFYGYFFCNKALLNDYLTFAIKNKFNYDVLVMAKTNPVPSYNNHHLPDLEYIVMIRKKGSYFSKHKVLDDFRKFFITTTNGVKLHPAEKPVELLERFVRVSSREGDLILDPFAGSGSTLVACKNNGRNYIGFDINEKYCDIANKRLRGEL